MIELTELKLVTASNIINQRTKAGMTQAELGAKLNYSDKSVSKWERGEAIPDAYVLSEMAELFGVTVDYLLSSHDGWEPPKEEKPEEEAPKYSVDIIIAIAILGIWTMSLTAFVVLWLLGTLWWPVFAVALTVSLLTYMVLLCVFKRTKYLQFLPAVCAAATEAVAAVPDRDPGADNRVFELQYPHQTRHTAETAQKKRMILLSVERPAGRSTCV